MRRILFTLLSLSLGFTIYAEGIVSWLQTSHDFGTFKEETGKVACDIKFVNTGDTDIRISNVRPTCGCTASSYTLGAIAPGDTATITLTYNPNGRPGRFEKDTYVYTDGTPQKSIVTIKGNVIGSPATIQEKYPISAGGLKLEKRIIPFGELTKGKSRTLFISAYNQSEDSLTAEFTNLPKYIDAEMIPPTVNPGEQSTITITFHSESCNDWGLTQDSFVMETLPANGTSNNASAGIVNIDITAILKEHFDNTNHINAPIAKLSTDKVDFGRFSLNGGIATRTLKITNAGKTMLKIRKIYTLDSGVEILCKKNEIKPGKTAEVVLSVNPQDISKILNAKIIVITNDPEKPQQTVRLVGQINETISNINAN